MQTGVLDVGFLEDIHTRYLNAKVVAEPILPDTSSLGVVNMELVGDVKELFARHEQKYYVARQFNQVNGFDNTQQ